MHHRDPLDQHTPAAAAPRDFACLARRIARRTTDLLAIAIVAAALASIAGRLTGWWRTSAEDLAVRPPGAAAAPWSTAGQGVSLAFGERFDSLEKRRLAGDREQAVAALLEACRNIVAEAPVPIPPPDAAERSLLEHLGSHRPDQSRSGRWRLHRLEGPLPIVLGTRSVEADFSAAHAWRVVCWGLAVPSGESEWTLVTLRATAAPGEGALPGIELPAGCRRILALGTPAGDGLTTFAGDGAADGWREHFDGWFERQGWRRMGNWTVWETGWTAKFVREREPPGASADVSFQRTADGRWNGVVHTTATTMQEQR